AGHAGACPAAGAALWTSNDLIITVTPGAHSMVALTFQPGSVAVAVSYTGTAATCPEGEFQCRTSAVKNPDHCSTHSTMHDRCGVYCRECRPSERCLDGLCTRAAPCPAGQFRCPLPGGSTDECSDHSSNPAACGSSCTACAATQSCMGGV